MEEAPKTTTAAIPQDKMAPQAAVPAPAAAPTVQTTAEAPKPAPEHKPFVHLHVHSDYSLLDGCAKLGNLIKRAESLNMPALALTDHGNLFGLANFVKTAEKMHTKVKPILGCELYLVVDHPMSEHPQRRTKGDDYDDTDVADSLKNKIFHMGVIAATFEGYKNLSKIVSLAHTKGLYYKPRVDIETLAANSKGLIGLTGCMQGVVPQHLLRGDWDGARRWISRFIDIFGKDHYFAELMNHGLSQQIAIDRDIIKIAKEFGLRTVCTNDIHYVMKADADPHDAMLCVQTGSRLIDEKRFHFPVKEFYMKSREEMAEIYGEIPDAMDNTLAVAEMCDVKLPFGANHYPVYTMPEGFVPKNEAKMDALMERYTKLKNGLLAAQGKPANFAFKPEQAANIRLKGSMLFDICVAGFMERYGIDYFHPEAYVPQEGQDKDYAATLVERMDYEFSIIAGTGFCDYFLIVQDFINWSRSQGISVGPGRGSGAGSLVAYCVHITDIDPIRFHLLFERFLNPERVSPPDFDVDFCMRRRDEVVEYVRQKYGKECVSNIITFGTFGAKAVVRDMARVMDVDFSESNHLAKMVPDDIHITLDKAIEKSAELANEVKNNKTAQEIVRRGKVLEGMVRNTGKHACGIIIGDRPLVEIVPMTLQEGALTTQYPKEPVEELGLLKMDFLGLKNLTVIADAEAMIRSTADPKFDISKTGYEDQKTFDLLNSGKTVGVFQLESGGMQSLCRQFHISTIDEIVALIALYRPGPMDLIPQYIAGKKDPHTIKYAHPLLEPVCRETYGIMVYQEQVMEAAKRIAGYTLGGADILRRAMGKKKVEVMAAEKAKFVKGAKETNNIPQAKAEEIFALLEKFAGYGFNKSHSAAYAVLSYRTAYLKAHYPVQYMAALLGCELGNADKLKDFIEESVAMGIKVAGPDVNRSDESFTPVPKENTILFGLGAIKGVGEGAAKAIKEERKKNGDYKDFHDFLTRVDGKAVNRRVIEALILTGGFDRLGQDRGTLLAGLDILMKNITSEQEEKSRGQTNLFDFFGAEQPASLGGSGPVLQEVSMPMEEKLQHEKDLLGFYVSGHPMNRFKGIAEGLSSFREEEYLDWGDRTPYRLCGVILSTQKKITKKDNRAWAILSIGTRSSTYQVNFYPEAYGKKWSTYQEKLDKWKKAKDANEVEYLETHKEPEDPLRPGRTVMIEGTVNRRNGESQLVAETVQDMERAIEDVVTEVCWVLDPKGPALDFLTQLNGTVLKHFGQANVEVGFRVADGAIATAELCSSLCWRIDVDDFARLLAHPAVLDVLVEGRKVEKREIDFKKRFMERRAQQQAAG
jgi:DNA polymerase-3 subunit alpha